MAQVRGQDGFHRSRNVDLRNRRTARCVRYTATRLILHGGLLAGLRLYLQPGADKVGYSLAQFHEFAVKKMRSAWKNQQLGTGLQAVDPGDGFLDINEFISVALDDEPWTLRLLHQPRGKAAHCGRHTDKARWRCFNGGANANGRAE